MNPASPGRRPYHTFLLSVQRDRVGRAIRRDMENPHAERQNVLLQRIIKNAVRSRPPLATIPHLPFSQDKCTEAILELNRCLEVRSFSSQGASAECKHRKEIGTLLRSIVDRVRKHCKCHLECAASDIRIRLTHTFVAGNHSSRRTRKDRRRPRHQVPQERAVQHRSHPRQRQRSALFLASGNPAPTVPLARTTASVASVPLHLSVPAPVAVDKR